MPADRERLLEIAVGAVADACVVCRRVQAHLLKSDSITKADRSPVTVADFASQAVVVRKLRQAFDSCPMIAEEASDALRQPGATALRGRVLDAVHAIWEDAAEDAVLDAIDVGAHARVDETGFWTLDPIDGTKGFLRGQQYAVSLAWIEAGEPVLGVLGCPNMSAAFNRSFAEADPHGVIYAALAGSGVQEFTADAPTDSSRNIAIRADGAVAATPIRVCESVESGHTSGSDRARIMDQLGDTAEPARLDGQGKYAVVARGQADAYLRIPTNRDYIEKIWDHAAGDIVAREAGCVVTDIRGERLDYSHGDGLSRNCGVVCATPQLHPRIIDAVTKLGL